MGGGLVNFLFLQGEGGGGVLIEALRYTFKIFYFRNFSSWFTSLIVFLKVLRGHMQSVISVRFIESRSQLISLSKDKVRGTTQFEVVWEFWQFKASYLNEV